MNMTSWALRSFVAVLILLLLRGGHVFGQESEIETVRRIYRENNQKLSQIVLSFQYTLEESAAPQPNAVGQRVRMAAKGDLRYFEVWPIQDGGSPAGAANGVRRGMSFDGQETRILLFNQHARLIDGDARDQFGAPDSYLALQGYPRSNYQITFPGKQLRSCAMSDVLSADSWQLAEKTRVSEHECLVLASATDRLCFAVDLNYALMRRELFDADSGSIWASFTTEDMFELQPGLWLGRTIKHEIYTDDRLHSRQSVDLLEHSIDDVPDRLFRMSLDSGTYVNDLRHLAPDEDGSRTVVGYSIPADPDDLEAVVAAAVEQQSGRVIRQARSWSRLMLMLIVNGLLLSVAVWIAYRRRQQAGRA